MDIKKHRQQYEYECVCGYCWIDSEKNDCLMCGEQTQITAEKYESLPPETFGKK